MFHWVKNKSALAFSIGLLMTASSGSFAFAPWDPQNDPNNLETNYERDFFALPREASLARLPWADTYWPSLNRGLAWRWYGTLPNENPVRVRSPEALAKMTAEELRGLSPIEKLDIYLGHTDQTNSDTFYYWLKHELARVQPSAANPVIDGWEGLCNGWAAASINHPEPRAVKAPVSLNVNGETVRIELPFSSSDLKGLMSLYYFERMAANPGLYRTLGGRCEGYANSYRLGGGQLRRHQFVQGLSAECEDTNAGAFHLVLTNQIGKRGESFIADMEPGQQVWNHPITGYKTRVLGQRAPSAGASIEAKREIVVDTEVYYMVEAAPSRLPFGAANSEAQAVKQYRYALELADNGHGEANRIVGGSWLSADRPDFLWKMNPIPFEGGFSVLNQLLQPVQQ